MKTISLSQLGVFIFIALFFVACQSNDEVKEDNTNPTSVEESAEDNQELVAIPFEANDLVYTWVDQLNIRDQPNLKGKTVASVQSRQALEFTGEKSENNDIVVLRGKAYDEPWLKVITEDKTEGWVFGGAVKHEGEKKGNNVISDLKFDFPYFGKFDLSDWKKVDTDDESGGDAEISTMTFEKDNLIIEFSASEMGDYGYARYYTLKDQAGETLKEREFRLSNDSDPRELTETVKDYTSSTPMEYTCIQKLRRNNSGLNANPIMANAIWSKSEIK